MPIDWDDFRIKVWQTLLILGAAYASTDARLLWAVPALTAMAGLSKSPASGQQGQQLKALQNGGTNGKSDPQQAP